MSLSRRAGRGTDVFDLVSPDLSAHTVHTSSKESLKQKELGPFTPSQRKCSGAIFAERCLGFVPLCSAPPVWLASLVPAHLNQKTNGHRCLSCLFYCSCLGMYVSVSFSCSQSCDVAKLSGKPREAHRPASQPPRKQLEQTARDCELCLFGSAAYGTNKISGTEGVEVQLGMDKRVNDSTNVLLPQ